MGAERIMKKVFSKKGIILKIIISLYLVLITVGSTACSLTSGEQQTEITVLKDESINIQIIESFDKPYYDEEDLRQSILTKVANYNRSAGSGNISVEKIEVEEQSAKVLMHYVSPEDYAQFNKTVFFIGSTSQAKEAGYDLNTVLSGVEDAMETIGMSDMLNMSDYRILITDSKIPITLDGKIEYLSSNATVSKNKKTVTLVADTTEPAYVMFR